MATLGHFAITFISFMIIDLLWLGVIARSFYRAQIGFLMKGRVNWIAAVLFYVLYIVGLLFFVIHPALAKTSWRDALLVGLFYGFVTYMTYDLTNLATLRDWPLLLTVVDILWGTVLCGATSISSYVLIRLLQESR
jgi:uncharacterized membrane protein